MTETIKAGSILVEAGAHLPESFQIESCYQSKGWAEVNATGPAFHRTVEEKGWTFFFMAGEITATAFGFDRRKSLRSAIARLIANVKSQHCNSIEISRVAPHSFLGMPYVSVSAHPRHLQKGTLFSRTQFRNGGQD